MSLRSRAKVEERKAEAKARNLQLSANQGNRWVSQSSLQTNSYSRSTPRSFADVGETAELMRDVRTSEDGMDRGMFARKDSPTQTPSGVSANVGRQKPLSPDALSLCYSPSSTRSHQSSPIMMDVDPDPYSTM